MAGEQKEIKLFREKSLQSIESPESLNDYLKVTSPGVWLVLCAVIMLLAGAIIWSIFGRIQTSKDVAVLSSDGSASCLIPYDDLENVLKCNSVTVEGITYSLVPETTTEKLVLDEDTNPYVMAAGDLKAGDVVVTVPLNAKNLEDGVYYGSAVTENIKPISLLLQ